MQSIQITAHVNDQGILQIPLPNHSGEELEILLVYQPISKPKKRQWSQQFLSTFGAWQGESLSREPQGEHYTDCTDLLICYSNRQLKS
ncbi:MAG: hypothetical protein PT118_23645 [Aphanizomenon gracile PMC644.10]|nr:hypothetical protein [Aphanizomenon gracile PMC627.10]MDM3862748.1 hypothetical protein [Aphanizomenon gracile PMC644.10]